MPTEGLNVHAAVSVRFSPRGGCTAELVARLNAATTTILLQAYTFTSQAIADALIAAHHRGVSVKVVLDERAHGAHGELGAMIAAAGVPTWLDGAHHIAHNKVIVIDSHLVATGSFNFSNDAELHNAENSIVIADTVVAALYEANFSLHLKHSEPFPRPPTSQLFEVGHNQD